MAEEKRERGSVYWYKADKRYGRIISDEFSDAVFVHFSSIVQEAAGFRELRHGQQVEYTRTIRKCSPDPVSGASLTD